MDIEIKITQAILLARRITDGDSETLDLDALRLAQLVQEIDLLITTNGHLPRRWELGALRA